MISAFPVLSARDGAEFDRTCAGSTRAILLMSWLGTAVIAAMAGLAAGVVSAAVGVGVSLAAPAGGKILAAGVAVVAAGCAVIAFGAVAYLLDRGDLKAVLGRLRRIVRSRS